MKQGSAFYTSLDNKMVYLLLGSNLGDSAALLEEAIEAIAKRIGTLSRRSAVYETQAWGKEDQPNFLNQAIAVETNLSPLEVLEQALWIEKELGRVRLERWGARLIDIDVILYGNEVVDIEDKLQVPHPQMQNRRFVLEPLAEIAGAALHPILNQTISEILLNLNDTLEVSKTKYNT